jgi:hypothetical protein
MGLLPSLVVVMEPDRGPTLLAIARGAIASELGEVVPDFADADWLRTPSATFVTLHLRGQLRGCIGSLQARRPLGKDVAMNAKAAAFQDDRFSPLSRQEYPELVIEVSLLSPLEAVVFDGQEHLLSLLRPGVDGLVLEFEGKRGTFLPQVWAQLPEPSIFLDQLKRKAGLPAPFWDADIRISRYTVTEWKDPGVRHG